MTLFKWKRMRPANHAPLAGYPTVKLIHSFYRSSHPSGENQAVQQQLELLGSAGFDVELFYLESDDLTRSRTTQALTALGLATGQPAAEPPAAWFEGVDVLHIHNTFPNISHWALTQLQIPMVLTAHNYRAFCANGLFLRQGRHCTECASSGPVRSIRYGCYRDSRLLTLPIAAQQGSGRSLRFLMSKCHTVLVPGAPMAEIFRGLGVDNAQVLEQPVEQSRSSVSSDERSTCWLFAGRLSAEKGLLELLHIWPHGEPLTVVGDGPLAESARAYVNRTGLAVTFRGPLPHSEVRELMAQCAGLVFSSIALEGAPLVYGEAMEAGLPVVAAEGSNVACQVGLDGTGSTFRLGDKSSLTNALELVSSTRGQLAYASQSVYTTRYEPESWMVALTQIYRLAILEGPIT
jgi:glycosyltransferase involved in cell wall biosynthesis